MIVSHEWLKQFVPHALDADTIGELLSRHCVTLDGIARIGAELEPFVVAQVVAAGRHPNSERLWVTKVDDGSGTLQDVVCGAPNVVVGNKYPFARTGTTMPGGLTIEKRKIRGETSNGMLCSPIELGLGRDADGIMTLDTDAAPGTPLLEVLPLADSRLTLDVLPNRPDLLSHRGVAREVAAITGVPCMPMPVSDLRDATLNVATASGIAEASIDGITVRVDDTTSCPMYFAIVIRGVTVGPSPEWLVKRLDSIGQRSISNVVDATNYILHAFGQPVHAFDLATLHGSTIVVRPTVAGESLVTLDGHRHNLAEGTTVICDATRPVALAGVMGGKATEVSETTTDVLLEVALFEPRFVRRVRQSVGVSTDASYRFERGIDAAAVREVALVGGALIAQVAGGTVGPMVSVGTLPAVAAEISLRLTRLALLLGTTVSADDAIARLESLGCTVRANGDVLQVRTPTWRSDLLLEVDLIEEVARLGGFDALPDELRAFRPGNVPDHPLHITGRRVRDTLVSMGLSETRPMPFTATGDEHTPRVRNPLAEDEPFLRTSLLDTLSRRAEYNLSRMQGNIRLFEIGNAFVGSESRLPREEVRAGALLLGSRRPPHFTEPEPPAYDVWDAKAMAEQMAHVAFPGEQVTLIPADHPVVWKIEVSHHGCVGHVERLQLDRPVWASDAFGVEITLGTISSADVAAPGRHAHTAVTAPDVLLPPSVRVKSLPVTPVADFDVALLVPNHIHAAVVEATIRATAGELLEQLELFDEFRGAGIPEGFRSLAWRLTFRHPSRTLREKEIEGRRAKLLDTLDKELNIRTRAT